MAARVFEPTKVAFIEADNSHSDMIEIEEKDATKAWITFIEPRGILIDFTEFEGVAAVL